jgi:hypothetical protein
VVGGCELVPFRVGRRWRVIRSPRKECILQSDLIDIKKSELAHRGLAGRRNVIIENQGDRIDVL